MSVEQLAAALRRRRGPSSTTSSACATPAWSSRAPGRPYMDYSLRLPRLDEIGSALHRIAREQSGDVAEDDTPTPTWASPPTAACCAPSSRVIGL